MQLVVSRWRISLVSKIPFTQIQSPIPTPTWWSWSSLCLTQQLASFHSTPHRLDKWKKKWVSDLRDRGASKAYIKYASRQKRSESKKALDNLLSNFGTHGYSSEEKFSKTVRWDEDEADDPDIERKKDKSMSSAQRRAIRSDYKKMKRRQKRNKHFDKGLEEEEEHAERVFQDFFGKRRRAWSINMSWEEFRSQHSTTGFEWRECSNDTYNRNNKWANESDAESDNEYDNESYSLGSSSDRTLLGLPARGPLKIEDIKNAFRLSALKWHPDKHPGSGQVAAEEKFKECVAAYKSLCSSLSSS